MNDSQTDQQHRANPAKRRLSAQIRAAGAVAHITFIASLRSKMLPAMSCAIILALLVLHGTLKGDGTLTGHLTVLLRYSLSIAIALAGIALIWSSCAAIAQDIEEKHIQMVRVKPITASALWLGKWLGLMAGQLILVVLAGITSAILIVVTFNSPRHDSAARDHAMNQLLTGRLRIVPEESVTEADIREFITARPALAATEITPQLAENIRAHLNMMHNSVSPGEHTEWQFNVPAINRQDGPVTLRIRGLTAIMRRAEVDAKWLIIAADGEIRAELPMDYVWSGTRLIEFPADSVLPGETVTVRFINGAGSNDTLTFDPHDGIDMRIPAVPFSLNLFSAMVIVLCKLAVLAALGVTLGACFSFPVASFNHMALLFILLLAGFFAFATTPDVQRFAHDHHRHDHDDHEHTPGPEWLHHISESILVGIDFAAGPVTRFQPVGQLADGIKITAAEILNAILIMPGGYGILLWLLGSWLFSKRELALPER